MFGIGMSELVLILAIGLLVLGPKRLPELASSLGRAVSELRNSAKDVRREFAEGRREPQAAPTAAEKTSLR